MQDLYSVTTPASEQPIVFNTASNWCRDIAVADTTLVTSLIAACTDIFESQSNRVFVQRSITGKFDCFQSTRLEYKPFVEIRRSPLVSVFEVRVNGDALDLSEYVVKDSQGFSRILFLGSHTLDEDLAYAIEVDFVVGYGAAADVPEDVKTAIQQWILLLYENRGDISTDVKQKMPFVTYHILKKYRIVNSFG